MTKTSNLLNKDKEVIAIEVETKREVFRIPVVDVRRGDDQRRKANEMIKATNQSKFMKPTFAQGGGCYQRSPRS